MNTVDDGVYTLILFQKERKNLLVHFLLPREIEVLPAFVVIRVCVCVCKCVYMYVCICQSLLLNAV